MFSQMHANDGEQKVSIKVLVYAILTTVAVVGGGGTIGAYNFLGLGEKTHTPPGASGVALADEDVVTEKELDDYMQKYDMQINNIEDDIDSIETTQRNQATDIRQIKDGTNQILRKLDQLEPTGN